MPNPSFRKLAIAVALAAIPLGLWSQTASVSVRDSVVDLLLSAAEISINVKA